MSQAEFDNLQAALVYVFGPIVYLWLSCLGAGGLLLAIWNIWLGLLRWLSKRQY